MAFYFNNYKLTGYKMKPFDLEAAKRGEPIVCKDGTPAKFIAHIPEFGEYSRVLFYVKNGRSAIEASEAGKYSDGTSNLDLFMASKKRTVWVNFFEKSTHAHYFSSQELADETAEFRIRIGGKAYPVEVEE